MVNGQYQRIFKRCLCLSIFCYVISFCLPVYVTFDDVQFGQGIWMFLLGWIVLPHRLFFVWLANPIFIILHCKVWLKNKRNEDFVSSLSMRITAYLSVFLGFLFFLGREMIEDEGGCMHHIKTFHVGYWMWETSMILLSVALMAKSGEQTIAYRIVEWYLRVAGRISFIKKLVIAVSVAVVLEVFSLRDSSESNLAEGPLSGIEMNGPYQACERIRLSFMADDKVVATISSADFVGHFAKDVKGRYSYKPPYIFIDWDGRVDMKYIHFDSLGNRMIMYGTDETYYLGQSRRENVVNHPMSYNERVIIPDNDYYVVDSDSLIDGYGTDAQQLRLPDGYNLTYAQIQERQIQKIGGLHEDGTLPILYHRENQLLSYEDDSLMIVFSRLCFETDGSNHLIGLKDYSVIPMIVFDKRKMR